MCGSQCIDTQYASRQTAGVGCSGVEKATFKQGDGIESVLDREPSVLTLVRIL